jgi:hypothetical protein
MTIGEKVKSELCSKGLSTDEAQHVLGALKTRGHMDSMKERWDDSVTDYPLPVLMVTMVSADREAAEWLAKNKPEHWARAMFA